MRVWTRTGPNERGPRVWKLCILFAKKKFKPLVLWFLLKTSAIAESTVPARLCSAAPAQQPAMLALQNRMHCIRSVAKCLITRYIALTALHQKEVGPFLQSQKWKGWTLERLRWLPNPQGASQDDPDPGLTLRVEPRSLGIVSHSVSFLAWHTVLGFNAFYVWVF